MANDVALAGIKILVLSKKSCLIQISVKVCGKTCKRIFIKHDRARVYN